MEKYIFATILGAALIFYPLPSHTPGLSHLEDIEKGGLPHVQAASDDEVAEPLTYKVWVTAYSSTPEETDATPYITAKNTKVRDGVLAANFLPFGTKVLIPKLFGNKVFVVEDRMHSRKTNFVDVWMASKNAAQEFGISYTDIVVLN